MLTQIHRWDYLGQKCSDLVLWHTTLISALRRLRQACEFKKSLVYMVNTKSAGDCVSKKKMQTQKVVYFRNVLKEGFFQSSYKLNLQTAPSCRK